MGARGKLAIAVVSGLLALGCLSMAAGAAARSGGSKVRTSSSVEESIRDCANRQRQEHGLRHLDRDRALDRAARFHARRMLARGFFDHEDPSGDGPADRVRRFTKRRYVIVGENLAVGFESAAAACRGWMDSPTHRANILRSSFTRVGGGFAAGSSHYGRFYVQVFADVAG